MDAWRIPLAGIAGEVGVELSDDSASGCVLMLRPDAAIADDGGGDARSAGRSPPLSPSAAAGADGPSLLSLMVDATLMQARRRALSVGLFRFVYATPYHGKEYFATGAHRGASSLIRLSSGRSHL